MSHDDRLSRRHAPLNACPECGCKNLFAGRMNRIQLPQEELPMRVPAKTQAS